MAPDSGKNSHLHALTGEKKALRIALALTAAVMAVEVAGGLLSGSLALLADAGHMLTDAAALGLSLFAFWLSSRPRTAGRTFGWRRFEIFAAFLNGLGLWVIAAVIGYEAVKRLSSPRDIKSGLMMVVAAVGLASNIIAGVLLYRGRERSLNVKGAFLHVMADAVGSLGVLAASLLIWITGSFVWDPLVSAGVCVLILWSSSRLIRESFHIFMEGAPGHLDVEAIREVLSGIPGIVDVHDLHVWTITSGFVSLSAHLKIAGSRDFQEVIRDAGLAVSSKFGILHTTFQPESADEPGCETHSCP